MGSPGEQLDSSWQGSLGLGSAGLASIQALGPPVEVKRWPISDTFSRIAFFLLTRLCGHQNQPSRNTQPGGNTAERKRLFFLWALRIRLIEAKCCHHHQPRPSLFHRHTGEADVVHTWANGPASPLIPGPSFFLSNLFYWSFVGLQYCQVSGAQLSDLVIHVWMFLFMCFSIVVYCRILNIVPGTVQ